MLKLTVILALLAVGLLVVAVSTGCAIATPFRGPGFDPGAGVMGLAPDDTVVFAVTTASLGSERRAFDEHTQRVARSMNGHEGLIGFALRKQLVGNEVWTMSAWTDDEALDRFVASNVHRRAIEAGSSAMQSARFRRVRLPARDVPLSWGRAIELLAEDEARGY